MEMKSGLYVYGQNQRINPAMVFEVSNKESTHHVVAELIDWGSTKPRLVLSCNHDWLEARRTGFASAPEGQEKLADRCNSTRGLLAKGVNGPCKEFVASLMGVPDCDHIRAVKTFLKGDQLQSHVVECANMGLQGNGLKGLIDHLLDFSKDLPDRMVIEQREVSLEEMAFKTPILLLGSAGSGKTTLAYKLAEAHGAVIEKISCFRDIKPYEILGNVAESPSGQKGWQDRGLSRAFRLAARGQKVVVLIDEVNRTDSRVQSIFLGAMTRTLKGVYVLETGRCFDYDNDPGLFYSERLEAPCENICFVATGNAGLDYDVEDLDPAFKDRFGFVKYFNSELSVLEEILTHIHGASRETVDKLKHFFTVTNNPGMQSKLALAPSVRAIDRIYTEFGGNWRGALLAQRDKWVHLIDGTPDETMVQELTEIIHKL